MYFYLFYLKLYSGEIYRAKNSLFLQAHISLFFMFTSDWFFVGTKSMTWACNCSCLPSLKSQLISSEFSIVHDTFHQPITRCHNIIFCISRVISHVAFTAQVINSSTLVALMVGKLFYN